LAYYFKLLLGFTQLDEFSQIFFGLLNEHKGKSDISVGKQLLPFRIVWSVFVLGCTFSIIWLIYLVHRYVFDTKEFLDSGYK
jgi:hypothetical protein